MFRGLIPSSRYVIALVLAGSAFVFSVAGPPLQAQVSQLTAAEVAAVLRASAEAIGDPTLAVAVVDRQARILGVYARAGAGGDTPDVAVTVARTAALFSNNQAPLSSRTVRRTEPGPMT